MAGCLTTINHPISCFSQGGGYSTIEVVVWRTIIDYTKSIMMTFRNYLVAFITKGHQEGGDYQRLKIQKIQKKTC
jgi:hypothetical protein